MKMSGTVPIIKSHREIEKMKVASQMVAKVLTAIESAVKPGVTTGELDELARDMISEMGGQPIFLGYGGFPKHICASVNEEIVHGIPSDERVLQDGDIVSVDCGIRYEKYCGDSALTIPVGSISEETKSLLSGCQGALYAAIERMQPGNKLRDVCGAIQDYAQERGYAIVRNYVGHGIGRSMHEAPEVPNYINEGMPYMGWELKPGCVLAIEPMLNVGTEATKTLSDDWTVVTADGNLSAHFEHTIAITENGPEILTLRENEL